ncbi:hypothetical protein [Nocardiopsis baichengensis]|uniref:hypothetical protein n=1 Tax=Nocardiopsis baichengensis TaxID=280240 RepID=UPI00034C894B|nr:hypothetical protein [Nocardiopsis baichengensis]
MSQPRRRPRVQFSRSFKGWLLSPVILLFLSACRLLLVANYDTTTAMTISSTVGAISTLLGTMIPILSAYLPALALFFAAIRSWRSALLAGGAALLISPAQQTLREAAEGVWTQITSLFAGLDAQGADYLLTRADLVWIGGFAALWIGVARALKRWPPSGYAFYFIEPEEPEKEEEPEEESEEEEVSIGPLDVLVFGFLPWLIPRLVPLLLMVGAFMFVQNAYSMTFSLTHLSHTVRLPWMPPEEITTEKKGEESKTQVAYVLSVSGEWTVLLEEDSRTIAYVPSAEVKERTVCELSATSTAHDPPLFKLKGAERPDLPDCDDLKESTS